MQTLFDSKMNSSITDYLVESIKKQGLSFALIAFIAWLNYYNHEQYKFENNDRIFHLEKSILECNQYNRSVTQNAIQENTKQLIINNKTLKDNNDLINRIKDHI